MKNERDILAELSGYGTTLNEQEIVNKWVGRPITEKSWQENMNLIQGRGATDQSEQQLLFNNLRVLLNLTGQYTDFSVQEYLNKAKDAGLTMNDVLGIADPVTPPMDTPQNLAVTAGDTSNALVWDAVTGATGYKVYRSTTTGTEVFLANSATNSYSDTGLTNGTTYYYKITAVGTNPESDLSSEANGTPVAAGPTVVYLRPTSDISLNMTPSSGTDGYSMVNETVADDAGTTLTRIAMGTNYDCHITAPNIPDGATDIVLILGIRASGGTFELDSSFGDGLHSAYGDGIAFTDWALSEKTFTTNPWDSDNPWTVANINTLDSLSIYNFASGAVTQIYAKITYTPA